MEALLGTYFKKELPCQLWEAQWVNWLSLAAALSLRVCHSIRAETTLFPGSSQPITEHSRGTRSGRFCWYKTPWWAICVQSTLLDDVKLLQSSSAAWSSVSPIVLPSPSSFIGVRLTWRSSCSLSLLFFTGITPNISLTPLASFSHLLKGGHKWQLLLNNEVVQRNTTEKRTNQTKSYHSNTSISAYK